jgi:hypothetical protein
MAIYDQMTEQEAERCAIENIVRACNRDAALVEIWRAGHSRRFAAIALSEWERHEHARDYYYYNYRLVQVFERGDYDEPKQEECGHLARTSADDLPATNRNRLRVDAIMTETPRCLLKRPSHWPESASALRWIGSGGSAFVFGHCVGSKSARCPLNKQS